MEDISFEKPKPGTAAVYYDKNTNPPKVLFIQTADGERYIPAPKKGDQSKPFNPTEDALPDTLGRLDFGYTGTEKNNRQLQTLLKAAQQAVLKKYSEQVAFEKLMDSTSKSAKETHAPTEEDGEAPQEVKKTGPIKGYKIHQYHFLHAEDDDNEPAPNLGSRAVSGISAAASATGRTIASALGFNKQQKQYKIQSSRLSAPLEQLKNEKPDLFSHAASTSTAQSANDAPPASSSSVPREIEIQDGEHSAVDVLSHDEADESIAKLLESTERELEIPDNSSRAQSKATASANPTTAAAPATSSITNDNNAEQPQEAEFEPLERETEESKQRKKRASKLTVQPLSGTELGGNPFVTDSEGESEAEEEPVAATTKRALVIQCQKIPENLSLLALNAQPPGFNFTFEDGSDQNIITGRFENFFIQINLATNTIHIKGPEFTAQNKQQETAILTNVIAACKNLQIKPIELKTPIRSNGRANRDHNRALKSTFESLTKAPSLLDQATATAKKIGAGIGTGIGAISAGIITTGSVIGSGVKATRAKLSAWRNKKLDQPAAARPIQQQLEDPVANDNNANAAADEPSKSTWGNALKSLRNKLPKFEKSESKDPGNTAFQLAIQFKKGLTASEIRSVLSRTDLEVLNIELNPTGFQLEKMGNHFYLVHAGNNSRIALTKTENEFAWTTTEKYGDDPEYVDNALTAMLTLYVKLTPKEKLEIPTVETFHRDEEHHFYLDKIVEVKDPDGSIHPEFEPKGEIGKAIQETNRYIRRKAKELYGTIQEGMSDDKKITEAKLDSTNPDSLKDAGIVLFSEILDPKSVREYLKKTLQENPHAFDFDYGDFKLSYNEKDDTLHLKSTEGVDIKIDLDRHIITTNKLNNSADYRAACRGMMFLHHAFSIQEMPKLQNPQDLNREKAIEAAKISEDERNRYLNAIVYFNTERTRIEYVFHNDQWYQNKMDEKKYQGIEFIDLKKINEESVNLDGFESTRSFHLEPDADLKIKALEAVNRDTLLLGTRAETKKGSVAGVQENREQIEKAQENRGTKFILCGNEHEGYYLMDLSTRHKIEADKTGNLQSDFYYGDARDLETLIQALVNNHIGELTWYQSLPAGEMEGKTVTLKTTIPAQGHSAKAMEDYKRIAEEVAKRTEQVVREKFAGLNFTVTCKKEPVEVGFSYEKVTQSLPEVMSPLVPKGATEDKSASITFGPGPQR